MSKSMISNETHAGYSRSLSNTEDMPLTSWTSRNMPKTVKKRINIQSEDWKAWQTQGRHNFLIHS